MINGGREGQTLVDLGVWTRSLPMEEENSDGFLVKRVPDGVFIAVADGLGHVREAADAAQAAVSYLNMYAGDSMISLLQRCHSYMKKTRGVVMNLAFFNEVENTLTWAGVGNVEGILLRLDTKARPQRESIPMRGGVIGIQLPELNATVTPVFPGDVLIFATDGISNTFADRLSVSESPQSLANSIGAQFFKGNDDALVLVAQYRGRSRDKSLSS